MTPNLTIERDRRGRLRARVAGQLIVGQMGVDVTSQFPDPSEITIRVYGKLVRFSDAEGGPAPFVYLPGSSPIWAWDDDGVA